MAAIVVSIECKSTITTTATTADGRNIAQSMFIRWKAKKKIILSKQSRA